MQTVNSLFTRNSKLVENVMWTLLAVVSMLAFASLSMAAGGGSAMTDLNDWIESELSGSVGMTIALIAFFGGVVAAVAMRQFMPIVYGIGIGLIINILLEVVTGTLGAGLPIAQTVGSVVGM